MHRLLAIAAALTLIGAASAQERKGLNTNPPGVYKWQDSAGIVHYDDTSLLEERQTRALLAAKPVAAEPELLVPEAFLDEVKARCTDYSERAKSYQQVKDVIGRSPTGTPYKMSPAEIAASRLQADTQKQRFCRKDAARLILKEERVRLSAQIKAAEARAAAKSADAAAGAAKLRAVGG